MLDVKDLSVRYGQIQALDHLSMYIRAGEIVSVIGANGAGKSTLLKSIAGLRLAMAGRITFEGKALVSKSFEMVRRGVALVPEGRRVFGNLTVYENLVIGSYLQKDKQVFQQELAEVYQLFPRLKERKSQPAATLSGGEQQMLAIGRAIMSRPKLLLLDEPSLGLAPKLVGEIFVKFKEINGLGVTLLLVEQNARQALALSDRAYVMQTGRIIKEGKGRELLQDPEVQDAYLGARKRD
ncbi:MAG: ABC transporter ATP-binding protein [Peptococcaceae bacterium]|nr:ABC transporter ATP-binding protein [Peptococcaceae bacterium]